MGKYIVVKETAQKKPKVHEVLEDVSTGKVKATKKGTTTRGVLVKLIGRIITLL